MCDTLVSLTDGGVMFAKNSDRDANEAQAIRWYAAADHEPDDEVRCTWISVPQVQRTNSIVVSQPWWMWGAEMGANEHGVAIGNEAVYTTEPDGDTALLGMDLLRLALERSTSADGAASVIVDLLEQHGQGGRCSFERPGATYHNSFLIADRDGAVVLETAGRHWAIERVTGRARSISNGLTIAGFAGTARRPPTANGTTPATCAGRAPRPARARRRHPPTCSPRSAITARVVCAGRRPTAR